MAKAPGYRNQITYCSHCGSLLLWDHQGRAKVLKLGNANLADCLLDGCRIIFVAVPEDIKTPGSLDLLLLRLKQFGVPPEEAEQAVSVLGWSELNVAA